MTVFLVVGALLLVGALLYILRPLLRVATSVPVSRDAANVAVYRDQLRELENELRAGTMEKDAYEKARIEIEQRLLEDVQGAGQPARTATAGLRGALALGVAIPVCALAVYVAVGTPAALDPQIGDAESASHAMNPERLGQMIDAFAARLKENPEDAKGWAVLARSYGALRRYEEASAAYAEAAKQNPNDAQLLADYADMLAMAQGRKLQGAPEKLIERALAIDPDNVKALALAGTIAFEREQFPAAIKHWERIVKLAPDSPFSKSVQESIAEAQTLLKGGGRPAPASQAAAAQPPPVIAPQAPQTTAGASSSSASPPAGRISGVAKLSPELARKVDPTDSVFIFARAVDGPRLPLAIMRKQAKDLPVAFVLDDSMAMNPEMKLSSVRNVIVTARVSKKADATTQPGDLQGQSPPVKIGAQQVEILINTVVR